MRSLGLSDLRSEGCRRRHRGILRNISILLSQALLISFLVVIEDLAKR